MNQQKDLKYFMKLNYNVILKRKDSYYYLFIPELSIIVEDKDLDIAYKKLEEETGISICDYDRFTPMPPLAVAPNRVPKPDGKKCRAYNSHNERRKDPAEESSMSSSDKIPQPIQVHANRKSESPEVIDGNRCRIENSMCRGRHGTCPSHRGGCKISCPGWRADINVARFSQNFRNAEVNEEHRGKQNEDEDRIHTRLRKPGHQKHMHLQLA